MHSVNLAVCCVRFSNITGMEGEGYDLQIYGDPGKVVHYMDYSENPVPDNSRYIPDLVPGILQPLQVYEIDDQNAPEDHAVPDELLSKLDVDKLIQDTEKKDAEMKKTTSIMDKQMEQLSIICPKKCKFIPINIFADMMIAVTGC